VDPDDGVFIDPGLFSLSQFQFLRVGRYERLNGKQAGQNLEGEYIEIASLFGGLHIKKSISS
jgi:hypothetical protein